MSFRPHGKVRLLVLAGTLLCITTLVASASHTFNASWTQLFNEKDLSGWTKMGKEKWIVEEGVIHGEGITNAYGYLATEKSYSDFHLSLRFKCMASGNSGVYIHTQFKPGTTTIVQGRQVEIDRTIGRHTGGLYGDDAGWLVWPAPELETVIRPHDWNHLLIIVEGKRHITRLNGVQMVDFTYPDIPTTEGRIALQLHSGGEGRMQFKDIWIRDLGE